MRLPVALVLAFAVVACSTASDHGPSSSPALPPVTSGPPLAAGHPPFGTGSTGYPIKDVPPPAFPRKQ